MLKSWNSPNVKFLSSVLLDFNYVSWISERLNSWNLTPRSGKLRRNCPNVFPVSWKAIQDEYKPGNVCLIFSPSLLKVPGCTERTAIFLFHTHKTQICVTKRNFVIVVISWFVDAMSSQKYCINGCIIGNRGWLLSLEFLL